MNHWPYGIPMDAMQGFNHYAVALGWRLKVLAREIKQHEEIICWNEKGDIELSLLVQYMISCVDNHKHYENIMELINYYSKVTGSVYQHANSATL